MLEANQDQHDFSYETLARNLDANLAEIDMDDFRSEDIHQLLTLPNMCQEYQVSIFKVNTNFIEVMIYSK